MDIAQGSKFEISLRECLPAKVCTSVLLSNYTNTAFI